MKIIMCISYGCVKSSNNEGINMQLADPVHKGKYELIYADPPWNERGGGRIKRGADKHYSLMKTGDIKDIPVLEWGAPDSFLFMWVTNNFLVDGLDVMKSWGYEYKTNAVWKKDRIGLGFYFRGQHELCLLGVRGKPEHSRQGKTRKGRYIPSSVIEAKRSEHSVKPYEMYDIMEEFAKGYRLEMFARNERDGWDSWGYEVGKNDINYQGSLI